MLSPSVAVPQYGNRASAQAQRCGVYENMHCVLSLATATVVGSPASDAALHATSAQDTAVTRYTSGWQKGSSSTK